MKKQLSDEIFESIAVLNHAIRARHHQLSREQGSGIAGMEFKALKFIATHEGATQKDLVERSGRDKGQIARVISNLKAQGLVEACLDEKDRRISRLSVTPQGRALHGDFEKMNVVMAEQAVAGMSAEECQTLLALLGKVNANLALNPGN